MSTTNDPSETPRRASTLVGAPVRALGGLVASLVLLLIGAVATLDLIPPSPKPESAPQSEFSATRAAEHLPVFATTPHPTGTPAADRARDELVDRLRELALEPQVHEALGASPVRSGNDGSELVGTVDNVVAVVPGSDSSGRVFLLAHYDSSMNSPGAADNGAAVAAILETVRALQHGEELRNDIVVVFTDGEEPGMLGADAFVRHHPLAQNGGVVLNLEAGGSHGPSTVFETSAGNRCLLDAYGSVPHPFGDSATASFFELTSHNTDLGVFTSAGFAGLTSGFFRGTSAYHTPLDTIENLSPASLQHHGANLLDLTRTFGAADLGEGSAEECEDAVFFTAFGQLVQYPTALALPLGGLSLVLLVGAIVVARRRDLLRIGRTLMAFGAAAVMMAISALASFGLWEALVAVRPGYADFGMGDPHRAELYRFAIVALTAAVLVGWYALLRRLLGPTALALGAMAWPVLIGVIAAGMVPGMSYLFTLPALGGTVGIAVALVAPSPRWRLVALTAGAAVSALFLPQLVWELLASSGGIASGAMVAFLIALLAVPFLPLIELAFRAHSPTDRRSRVRRILAARGTGITGVLLVLAVSLSAAGLAIDRFDADHPRPAHLHYVVDDDTQTAAWVSRDRQPSDWTCDFVTCGGEADPRSAAVAQQVPWFGDSARTGLADPADLAAPEVAVLDDRLDGDVRVLEVRVRSAREAPVVTLYSDRPVTAATVDGLPLADITDRENGPWAFGLEIHGPSTDGVVVTLRVENGGSEAIGLRVVDHTYGLDDVPGFTPRPTGVGIAMAPSDVVSVGRSLPVPAAAAE